MRNVSASHEPVAAGAAAQASAGPLVRFRGVQKTYDGVHLVVRQLDLDIRRGEFLTLLGPSGSGKTTTLMMLAGFESPTAGDIVLEGKPITRTPPHKRHFGMVFQNYALFPHLSVGQNVAYPLTVRKVPKAEQAQRVTRALSMVRLDGMAERLPQQLSGGQQQRVALARALVFEPQLVLMDEPLGALDKQLREHMQLEIKHIHQSLGVTVVYVTHDQGEALTMSDRVAVFNDGAIQQLASPADLYEKPQNSFVAQFIGENNRLSGVVTELNGHDCRVKIGEAGEIRALPVSISSVGAKTTLSLRPERVRINPTNGACANQFDAKVEELIYLGDHTRARVQLLGHNNFVIKVPNSEGVPDLAPGATIRIGWRAEDCRALDAF